MRDNYPLVSIVTTSFNSGKTIKQTIESILAQTYKNIEYLIIDGKSSDNTLDIAESYKDKFEAAGIVYRITSEKDHGIYDGMNKGISKASGVIIGIVNSDDWLEPDAVENVVSEYNKSNFDVCFCDINVVRSNGKHFVKTAKIRKYKTSRDLCHPGMFVTAECYKKIGNYNQAFRVYADFDLWLRVFKSNVKIVKLNKIVSNYRLGGASTKKTFKQAISIIKEKYNCYRNNGYSRLYFVESFCMEMGKFVCMKFIG